MNHFIPTAHHRGKVRTVECQIQHVAVITPVRAENQQDAFMLLRRFFFRLFDLRSRVDVRGIQVFGHV